MEHVRPSDVEELVSEVVGVGTVPVGSQPLSSMEQWGSLEQLNVLLALEERYSIELRPEDVLELTSVDSIVALLDARR